MGTPANTSCQRLGFGNEWSGYSDYGEANEKEPEEEENEIEIEYKEGEYLSNSNLIETLKDLAKELGADKIKVTDGDRTKAEHEKLIKQGKTNTPYEETQHGSNKGYKAADVKFYKGGEQIDPNIVGDIASQIDIFGGIGNYDKFTHIDIRPRDPDGKIATWDERKN